MSQQLREYLAGAQHLYPHALEERYPRVLNNIAAAWDSEPDALACFDDLLMDRRGGRQGFPPDVAREIFNLSVAYEKLRPKRAKPSSDVWGLERDAKQALEDLGLRPTARDMLRAAETGDVEHLRLFLQSGMPIDTADYREWTPLMVASFHGNEAVARLLIESGANPSARDRDGYTPLHWASLQGFQDVVALLLKRMDSNVRSAAGVTPLLQAAANGHAAVVQLLLAAGAAPNAPSDDGWTPLHKAVANGHLAVVRALVAAGASERTQHPDGTTPIGLAIRQRHDEIVKALRQRAQQAQ